MHFEWPLMFLLLPLPLLVYLLLPALKTSASALYMPGLDKGLLALSSDSPAKVSRLALILMIIIWGSLITAAAKPVQLGDAIELPASGRDLLLAVDISGSMEYEDMLYQGRRVSRVSAVKAVLNDFLTKRQGDRVGLILYGSGAYIQAPLTFDLQTVQQLLAEAEIGFAGDGTAIGDAIGLSIKRLANNPADSRVVILLTDGQNSAGVVNPIEAAKMAKKEQVKIYTVGVGHPRSRRYPIDEVSLQKIATITEGEYFRARNISELQTIYNTIDQLETLEQEAEMFRPQQSLFHWPLSLMLLSLLILLLDKQFQFSHNFSRPTGEQS